MGKTITFSFASAEFKGAEATETFSFKQLELDETMEEKKLEIEIDRIYQAWVMGKLNISGTIVIEEQDAAY